MIVSSLLLASAVTLAPTPEAEVRATLAQLASFGEKGVGTDAGKAAGAFLAATMRDIGLEAVHTESFSFPFNRYQRGPLRITRDGQTVDVAYDVLESSGGTDGKTLTAPLAFVGIGAPPDLAGKDLTGKIALLRRDPNYDRAIQLENVTRAHAAAMLYVSQAPDNLRQVGTVRHTFEAGHALPAVSLGKEDGEGLIAAVQAGKTVTASLRLDVTTATVDHPGTGRNVLGRLTGVEADKFIVVGAHYDTWKTGSVDNGSGVAATLALARREVARYRRAGRKPRYTLVFVAYDGEEIDLYGGYEYLRRHVFTAAPDRILTVVNLEMPTGADPATQARYPDSAQPTWSLIHSKIPVLDATLQTVQARWRPALYPTLQGLDQVARGSGGLIATDIQPHYRAGIPTICTWTDTPYYHTDKDDLAHTDTTFLARAVDYFDDVVTELQLHDAAEFQAVDPALLDLAVTPQPRRSPADDLTVDVKVTDRRGKPAANVPVQAELHVRDYFLAWADDSGKVRTDASGRARFVVPRAAVERAPAGRFLDVTAGVDYPHAETSVRIP